MMMRRYAAGRAGPLFAILMLSAAAAGPVRADSDAWIKGTSDFLVDRANANFLYIFQVKLKNNVFFHDYFPETQRLVGKYDLRALLADKQLIRESLDSDVSSFLTDRVTATVRKIVDRDVVPPGLTAAVAAAKKALLGADVEQKQAATRAIAAIDKALACLDDLLGQPKNASVEAVLGAIRCRGAEARSLAADLAGVTDRDGSEAFLSDVLRALGESETAMKFKASWEKTDKPALRHVLEIAAVLNSLSARYQRFRTDRNAVAADKTTGGPRFDLRLVTEVLDLVELTGYIDANLRERIQRDGDFDDFRRYALFFAQLANATQTSTPEEVKALLASVAIPDVSFGVKRESNNYRWLITAYLGGAMNWQVRPYEASHTTGSMVAPIGLELARGRGAKFFRCDYDDVVEHKCQHSSLSVLLSPIDLGVPVAMRIAGVEGGTKLSDVIAPGVYFVYGVKNYPIAAGVGFVRGRSLQDPGTTQNRAVFFVGFDLPLYVLN